MAAKVFSRDAPHRHQCSEMKILLFYQLKVLKHFLGLHNLINGSSIMVSFGASSIVYYAWKAAKTFQAMRCSDFKNEKTQLPRLFADLVLKGFH